MGPEVQQNNIDQMISTAIEQGVWKLLTSMLLYWNQNGRFYVELYVHALDGIFSNFLTHMSDKAREMKTEEGNSIKAQQALRNTPYHFVRHAPVRPEPIKSYFSDLLRFVAELYQSQPELSQKFWEQETFSQFVRFAGENIYQYFFVPYMQMIASLASGPENSQRAFDFLLNFPSRGRNIIPGLGRGRVMDVSRGRGIEREGRTTGFVHQMNPEEQEYIVAILQVMRTILNHSDEVRTRMNQNPNLHV
jgi:hypothetical protein